MYTRTLSPLPLSSIPKKPIHWLWHPFIPRGKITLLAGDPGSGKTTLALHLAASLSRGEELPHITPGESPGAYCACTPEKNANPTSPLSPNPSATLLLSPDDNAADTLRPRLEQLGGGNANLDHIHILPTLHSLIPPKTTNKEIPSPSPLEQLDEVLASIPNLALLIIDPITHYLGQSDRLLHQDGAAGSGARSILHALAHLAEKHNIAILLTTRLNKQFDPANPTLNLQRIFGRLDFPTIARSVLLLTQTPNPAPSPPSRLNPNLDHNPNPSPVSPTHLLLPLKSNLTTSPAPLLLTLSETVTFHPNAPIPQRPQKKSGPDPLILQSTISWLHAALADGPQTAYAIRESARNNAISPATLNRARALANIDVIKQDWSGRWHWRLPNDLRPLPTDPLEKQMFELLNLVKEANSPLALADDAPHDLPDDLDEDPPASAPPHELDNLRLALSKTPPEPDNLPSSLPPNRSPSVSEGSSPSRTPGTPPAHAATQLPNHTQPPIENQNSKIQNPPAIGDLPPHPYNPTFSLGIVGVPPPGDPLPPAGAPHP